MDRRIALDEAYAAYETFVTQPFQRKTRYPYPKGSPLDKEIFDAAEGKRRALRRGDAALASTYRRKLRSLVRRRRSMVGDRTTRAKPLSLAETARRIRSWTGAHAEKAALGQHLAPNDFRCFLQLRSGSVAVNLAEPTDDPLPEDFLPSRGHSASEPASYRPVSILSHVRKVVEASLLRYLLEAYQPHAAQFAYIPGRRILTAVKQVDAGIRQGLDTVCLDLTAAFDMVDKHRVATYLKRVGLRQSLTSAVLLKLSSTRNMIKIGNTISSPFSTARGVPQGGCLSPVLFLFVMDALASKIAAQGAIPTLYSDDVAIQGDLRQVQQALDETKDRQDLGIVEHHSFI
ncbi:MAG: hypothetical protein KVP17_002983 [Porospora cf. gigantea B]|uniref:uncharacterized protein n=1 Tax=Porospora cf. gigantea B TaxID=2853592 RepID=UPI0035719361|nr:MAG: hypothetical protein KVP17_002983 [Porospora cf. gigantea B]